MEVNGWININDKLPESGQEVLIYYFDKNYEIHHMYILDYFNKGDVMDTIIADKYATPEENLLDTLFNSENEIKAPEEGFYIYDSTNKKNPYRKHANIITHWQPLPEPPFI